jgi:type II secretory pathway component GspD/PulD (secretin)
MILLRPRILVSTFAACALAAALTPSSASAQTTGNEANNVETSAVPEISETVFLSHATGLGEMNEIQTALRNNFSRARVYGVAAQYAITVRGTAADIEGMKKMIAELDRPRKVYRVTFNVSDIDNGKRTGTQHYTLVVAAGGKAVLKQGNRMPLITGMSGESSNAAQSSQVQYIDVGLSIEADIEGTALRAKIEQSGVTEQKSAVVAPDPIISQTMLEGSSALAANKPVVLGSIDVPGTTRRQEIEVLTEPLNQ